MNIDKIATQRIAELEAEADAQAQRIEVLLETLDELESENKMLKAQIAALQQFRKVNYEVA